MRALRLVILLAFGLASLSVFSQGHEECSASILTQPSSIIATTEGSSRVRLQSGRGVNFFVSVRSHCDWAVFWKDSGGDVFNLATSGSQQDVGSGLLEVEKHRLPSDPGRSYWLDNRLGVETIILVAAKSQLLELSSIGLNIAQSKGANEILSKFGVGHEVVIQEIDHF